MVVNYTLNQSVDLVTMGSNYNTLTNNTFGICIVGLVFFIFLYLGYKYSESIAVAGLVSGLIGFLCTALLLSMEWITTTIPLIFLAVILIISIIGLIVDK